MSERSWYKGSRFSFGVFILFLAAGTALAQKPILTDEFDRLLVTGDTQVGDVIGKIELIVPNPEPITWSLVAPVPGGDPRHYLREGQLDATTIVDIDPQTAEIRLKRRPEEFPGNYYAEVRASNEDGFMEEVLIVIALKERPKEENALDIFTQRVEAGPMYFFGTATVDPDKIGYAAKVATALLSKDRKGSGMISKCLEPRHVVMTIFKTYEERNTAIGFYMYDGELGLQTQDLEDEEIIPDYLKLGGPRNLRRDASVEEITHLIHDGGIKEAYPGVQTRLEHATRVAVERGFYRPQDGLPADSYPEEYLAFGLDILYGVRGHQTFDGKPLTPENLPVIDPELTDILTFLFPSREEFFREMGW